MNTWQNQQTNWIPRLLLHLQKSVGKSCPAKVAQQKLPGKSRSAKVSIAHTANLSKEEEKKKLKGALANWLSLRKPIKI